MFTLHQQVMDQEQGYTAMIVLAIGVAFLQLTLQLMAAVNGI